MDNLFGTQVTHSTDPAETIRGAAAEMKAAGEVWVDSDWQISLIAEEGF